MRPSRIFGVVLSVAVLSLLAAVASLAQDKASSSAGQSGTPNGTVTVTGCLTANGNRYTLGTMSDDLYVLKGDDAAFRKLNATRVQVTGTVSPSVQRTSKHDALRHQPPTLTVTGLKKVADTCS